MVHIAQVNLTDEEYSKNDEYFGEHYSELLEQYPDQWVAILEQRIVATADDGFELIARLRKKGIPPHLPLRRLVSTRPKFLIVPSQ